VKFLLTITVCSNIYYTCMPPAEMYPMYDSFTDCVMAGHENSLYVLKELGPRVESNRINAIFNCKQIIRT
jgi:hypothetical protein